MKNVNETHKESFTILDKVALFITNIVGTMWCAMAFMCLALVSLPQAIDGGAFTMVSWISQTFLQLVLLSIIMVGQNLQSRHSELRADADYETNVQAKKEIEALMKRLDDIEEKKLDLIIRELIKHPSYVSENKKLPIRAVPYEAVTRRKFNPKTDYKPL